jgi:hypothetical protein
VAVSLTATSRSADYFHGRCSVTRRGRDPENSQVTPPLRVHPTLSRGSYRWSNSAPHDAWNVFFREFAWKILGRGFMLGVNGCVGGASDMT